MSHLTYCFVHGLSGWGSYDRANQRMPYWGMRGGDLIGYLREKGYDCYAASVSPTGSAWDRACELYAQISGSRVDYGRSHSQKAGHERFGRDFSSNPLLPHWGEETRLVLLGHSFGGATVRLFSELLAYGDREEREAAGQADALSPLFAGGMGNRLHSLVTLASPMNGTTAYDLFDDPGFDPDHLPFPFWSKILARMLSLGTKPSRDDRADWDYADYDMHIDQAHKMNDHLPALPWVTYYSVPCCLTKEQPDGTHQPDAMRMEPLFVMRSFQIGAYTGKTRSGVSIDSSWLANDGLVNTSSARFPLGAPWAPLDREDPKSGLWNVFPTYEGDHMALQGGFLRKHDIRPFYLDLLSMIERTSGNQA